MQPADDANSGLDMYETPSTRHETLDVNAKYAAIQQAVIEVNIPMLVELASTPDGLIDDTLRRDAWPILLGIGRNILANDEKEEAWQDMPTHDDEEQVEKDVDRAFVYYPTGLSDKAIKAKKRSLSTLITRVLRTYPMLCYFQGYHDIAAVLLLVLDEEVAYSALANLSLFRIRDYMLPTIKPAEKHLILIPTILRLADPSLFQHISSIPVFYALAGTLTLYAHDIPNFNDISRLYDFLLAHEPIMAIYLFAAIITQRREKLLSISADDPDMMHYTLTKLTQQLELESLISQAVHLFHTYPPEKLPGRAWSAIPASSVLRTSRVIAEQQTVSAARQSIEEQKRLLAWEATRHRTWMYLARNRRPLLSLSSTVLVAGFAWWLRKNGHDALIVSTILHFSRHTWPS